MSEVTAPPAVQARLLELQELDTALDQARAAVRRLQADPEHARLRARGPVRLRAPDLAPAGLRGVRLPGMLLRGVRSLPVRW